MLGQSAGLQQKKIEDFKSATEYIQYLFTGIRGWICRGQITGEYSQQMYRFNGLLGSNHAGKNIYISMNTFFKPERTVDKLKRLNALYVDIDCYKLGLNNLSVFYQLEQEYFGTEIPVPTFVIDSGRGLYLIWKLQNEDRNALPRWTKVQKYLTDKLKDFGADPACKDSARILRLPFTVNEKSGTEVSILQFNDLTYKIAEIQDEYHIEQKKYKRKDGEKTHPYNTATEPMRQYATQLANKLGAELPDFEDFAATREWIAKMRVTVPSRPHSEEKAVYINPQTDTTMCRILQGYCADIESLFAMRKGADCKREIALFLYRLFTYDMTGDKEYALEKTLSFNAALSCPFPEDYVIRATKSAETKIDKGDTYHYKLDTIIDVLDITREEMKSLVYLINPGRRKERKQENNRRAYIDRLTAAGKETKAETQEKRRSAIIAMQKEGKSREEIMEALSISRATYYREMAAIAARNALEAARELIDEGTEIIRETAENAVETAVESVKEAAEVIAAALTAKDNTADTTAVPCPEKPSVGLQKSRMVGVSKIQLYSYDCTATQCRTAPGGALSAGDTS